MSTRGNLDDYWIKKAAENDAIIRREQAKEELAKQDEMDWKKRNEEASWLFKEVEVIEDTKLAKLMTDTEDLKIANSKRPLDVLKEKERERQKQMALLAMKNRRQPLSMRLYKALFQRKTALDKFNEKRTKEQSEREEQAALLIKQDERKEVEALLEVSDEKIRMLENAKIALSRPRYPPHHHDIADMPGHKPTTDDEEEVMLRMQNLHNYVPQPAQRVVEQLRSIEEVLEEERQRRTFKVGGRHHHHRGADKIYALKHKPSTHSVLAPQYYAPTFPEDMLLANTREVEEAHKLQEAKQAFREHARIVCIKPDALDLHRLQTKFVAHSRHDHYHNSNSKNSSDKQHGLIDSTMQNLLRYSTTEQRAANLAASTTFELRPRPHHFATNENNVNNNDNDINDNDLEFTLKKHSRYRIDVNEQQRVLRNLEQDALYTADVVDQPRRINRQFAYAGRARPFDTSTAPVDHVPIAIIDAQQQEQHAADMRAQTQQRRIQIGDLLTNERIVQAQPQHVPAFTTLDHSHPQPFGPYVVLDEVAQRALQQRMALGLIGDSCFGSSVHYNLAVASTDDSSAIANTDSNEDLRRSRSKDVRPHTGQSFQQQQQQQARRLDESEHDRMLQLSHLIHHEQRPHTVAANSRVVAHQLQPINVHSDTNNDQYDDNNDGAERSINNNGNNNTAFIPTSRVRAQRPATTSPIVRSRHLATRSQHQHINSSNHDKNHSQHSHIHSYDDDNDSHQHHDNPDKVGASFDSTASRRSVSTASQGFADRSTMQRSLQDTAATTNADSNTHTGTHHSSQLATRSNFFSERSLPPQRLLKVRFDRFRDVRKLNRMRVKGKLGMVSRKTKERRLQSNKVAVEA